MTGNNNYNEITNGRIHLNTYSNLSPKPREPMLTNTQRGCCHESSPNLNEKKSISVAKCSSPNNNLPAIRLPGTPRTSIASSNCHGTQCYPSKHPKLTSNISATESFASRECEPYYVADIPTFKFDYKTESSKTNFPTVLSNRNLLLESLLRTLSSEAWQLESTSPAHNWAAGPRHINYHQVSSPNECQVESKSLIEILESSLNVAPEPKRIANEDSVRKAPPKSSLKRLGSQDYEKLRLVNRGRRWKNVVSRLYYYIN